VLFLSLDTKPLKTMNYIQIPDYVYERILRTLQQGVDVCLNVDGSSDETEKSPHFANGYSRATMQDVIRDLNRYKETGN
jgi:hypothetical protein